jgi:serine/threonine-protein kinase RsbW
VSEIRLSVPARADYVHVLRSVVASVAAKLDFSYDDIEDLRLAVDEACAYLIALRDGPQVLTLSITPHDHTVDVLASVEGEDSASNRNGAQTSMVWHLLGALTDEARFEELSGQPGIRFKKSVGAGESA